MKIEHLRWAFFSAGAVALALGIAGFKTPAKADPWQTAPRKMHVSAPGKMPSVAAVISRDPFQGAPEANAADSGIVPTGSVPGTVPNPGSVAIQQGPGVPAFPNGALVPNAGSAPQQGCLSGDISIVAIVVGHNGRPSRALIRNGSEVDPLMVGDTLCSNVVVKQIVEQGIEFSDGSRLAVGSAPATTSNSAMSTDTNGVFVPNPNQTPHPVVRYPVLPPGVHVIQGSNGTQQQPQPAETPSNGVPVMQPSPYTFGPLPTPLPGQTPVPVPHLYTPHPGQ